jgi:hypothetical protein
MQNYEKYIFFILLTVVRYDCWRWREYRIELGIRIAMIK